MKTVPYVKKITQANTQYRQVTTQDSQWVIAQCKKLSQIADMCKQHGITEGLSLNVPRASLPKMSNGKRNSPATMCEGVVDNFDQGQYDLSDKQMDGITESFKIGKDVIEDFEEVEFEEVQNLPKLKPTQAPVPDNVQSTLSDLFDIESITVTYRKKP